MATTLAKQLSGVKKPLQKDIDPEDESLPSNSDQSDSESEQISATRQHYAPVSKSSLRSKQDTSALDSLSKKYGGIKSSSSATFVPKHDSDFEESDNQDDSEGDDLHVNDSASEDEDNEESEEDEEEDDEEEDDEDEEEPKKENKDLVEQLQSSALADVKKGKAVRKQLIFWDAVIEARIRFQKILTSANQFTPDDSDSPDDDVLEALEQLRELCDQLTSFRLKLMRKEDGPFNFDKDLIKRADFVADKDEQRLSQIQTLSEAYESVAASTISKWSDKVSAASLAQMKAAKSFKPNLASQNVWTQIQTTLNNDKERLIERTRKRKNNATDDNDDSSTNTVFDDSDFYTGLLKEVANDQLLNLDYDTYSNMKQKPKKIKKNVDTKASKGRKLRYEVHDKLQNFMVPIPAGTWHDTQISELFNSLCNTQGGDSSYKAPPPSTNVEQEPATNGFDIEPHGLRIFG